MAQLVLSASQISKTGMDGEYRLGQLCSMPAVQNLHESAEASKKVEAQKENSGKQIMDDYCRGSEQDQSQVPKCTPTAELRFTLSGEQATNFDESKQTALVCMRCIK